MEENLFLTVLTPERKLVEGLSVTSVHLYGSEGEIQILPGHAQIVGTLETGPFRYSFVKGSEATEEVGVISSGFFQITGNKLTVTAETLEMKNEIAVSRAREAQLKAEKMLQAADLEPTQFNKYQLKLQRAIIRQNIASS